MFGWFKKASQKTSLFNVSLATKTLISVCNRGYDLTDGEPSKLPPHAANEVAKAIDHLYKEIQVAKNVDLHLMAILDVVQKAADESEKSPLAELALSDVILNV